jgi:hypothetical protein
MIQDHSLEVIMFSPGYLQTGQSSTAWVGFLILAVLLLVLILWSLNCRKTDQAAEPSEASVQVLRETTPDDLVARVLNDAGITTFEDLARANAADIQKALHAAGLQMINPEGWIEQASLAARGDWEALERLQDELKGGRKK